MKEEPRLSALTESTRAQLASGNDKQETVQVKGLLYRNPNSIRSQESTTSQLGGGKKQGPAGSPKLIATVQPDNPQKPIPPGGQKSAGQKQVPPGGQPGGPQKQFPSAGQKQVPPGGQPDGPQKQVPPGGQKQVPPGGQPGAPQKQVAPGEAPRSARKSETVKPLLTEQPEISKKKKPTGPTKLERVINKEPMSGQEAVEVDNLVIKFNEVYPKCEEVLEKYRETISEENENVMNAIKQEICTTQALIIEQTNLLSVFDILKKFSDAVEKYQEASFERQKQVLIAYLESLLEALEIVYDIKSRVAGAAEGEIYQEYVSKFLKNSEEEVTSLEVQCQDRKLLPPGKLDRKMDLLERLKRLLQIYKSTGNIPRNEQNVSFGNPRKTFVF